MGTNSWSGFLHSCSPLQEAGPYCKIVLFYTKILIPSFLPWTLFVSGVFPAPRADILWQAESFSSLFPRKAVLCRWTGRQGVGVSKMHFWWAEKHGCFSWHAIALLSPLRAKIKLLHCLLRKLQERTDWGERWLPMEHVPVSPPLNPIVSLPGDPHARVKPS